MPTEIVFHGDKELLADFHKLANSYYDYAYEAAMRVKRKYPALLRKEVDSGGLRSNKNLTKGFLVSKPMGIKGGDLRLEFMGEGRGNKNPHWHLIEDGHVLKRPYTNRFKRPYKDGGAVIGSVAGKHFVDKLDASGSVDQLLEQEMTKALDQALEAGHFK